MRIEYMGSAERVFGGALADFGRPDSEYGDAVAMGEPPNRRLPREVAGKPSGDVKLQWASRRIGGCHSRDASRVHGLHRCCNGRAAESAVATTSGSRWSAWPSWSSGCAMGAPPIRRLPRCETAHLTMNGAELQWM